MDNRKIISLLENKIVALELELSETYEHLKQKDCLIKKQTRQLNYLEERHKRDLDEIETLHFENRKTIQKLDNAESLLVKYENSNRTSSTSDICPSSSDLQHGTYHTKLPKGFIESTCDLAEEMVNEFYTQYIDIEVQTDELSDTNIFQNDDSCTEKCRTSVEVQTAFKIYKYSYVQTEKIIKEINYRDVEVQTTQESSGIMNSISKDSANDCIKMSGNCFNKLSPVFETNDSERITSLEKECESLKNSLDKVKRSFSITRNKLSDAQLTISKVSSEAEIKRAENEKFKTVVEDYERKFRSLAASIENVMEKTTCRQKIPPGIFDPNQLFQKTAPNVILAHFCDVLNDTNNQKDVLHDKCSLYEKQLHELTTENNTLKRTIEANTRENPALSKPPNEENTSLKRTIQDNSVSSKQLNELETETNLRDNPALSKRTDSHKNEEENALTENALLLELKQLVVVATSESPAQEHHFSGKSIVRKTFDKLKAYLQVQADEIHLLRKQVEIFERQNVEINKIKREKDASDLRLNKLVIGEKKLREELSRAAETIASIKRDKEYFVREVNVLTATTLLESNSTGERFEAQLNATLQALTANESLEHNVEKNYIEIMRETASEIVQLMVQSGYKDELHFYNFTDGNMVQQIKTVCAKVKLGYEKQLQLKRQQHDKSLQKIAVLETHEAKYKNSLRVFLTEMNECLNTFQIASVKSELKPQNCTDKQMLKMFAELKSGIALLQYNNEVLSAAKEDLVKEKDGFIKNVMDLHCVKRDVPYEYEEVLEVIRTTKLRDFNGLQAQNNELTKENYNLKKAIEELQDNIKEYQGENKHLRNKHENQCKLIKEVQQERDDLRKKTHDFQEKLERLNGKLKSKIEKLKNIQLKNSENDDLRVELGKLQNVEMENYEITIKLGDLERQNANNLDALTELQYENGVYKNSLEHLKQLERENADFKKEICVLKRISSEIEQFKTLMKQLRTSLEVENDDFNEIIFSDGDLTMIIEYFAESKRQNYALKKKVDDLKNAQLQKESANLEEVKALKLHRNDLLVDKLHLKQNAEKIENENRNFKKKLQELGLEGDDFSKIIDEVKQLKQQNEKHEQIVVENIKLKKEIEELGFEGCDFNTIIDKVKELKHQNEQIINENVKFKKKLKELGFQGDDFNKIIDHVNELKQQNEKNARIVVENVKFKNKLQELGFQGDNFLQIIDNIKVLKLVNEKNEQIIKSLKNDYKQKMDEENVNIKEKLQELGFQGDNSNQIIANIKILKLVNEKNEQMIKSLKNDYKQKMDEENVNIKEKLQELGFQGDNSNQIIGNIKILKLQNEKNEQTIKLLKADYEQKLDEENVNIKQKLQELGFQGDNSNQIIANIKILKLENEKNEQIIKSLKNDYKHDENVNFKQKLQELGFQGDDFHKIIANVKKMQDLNAENEETIHLLKNEYKQKLDDINCELNNKIHYFKELELQNEILKENLQDLKELERKNSAKIEELEQENVALKQLESENAALNQTIDLKTQNSRFKEKYEDLKDLRLENVSLLKNEKTLEIQIADLQNTIEDLKKLHLNKENTGLHKNSLMKVEKDDLVNQKNDFTGKVFGFNDLKRKSDDIEHEDEFNIEVTSFNSKKKTEDFAQDELLKRNRDLMSKIAQLELDNDALKREIEELNAFEEQFNGFNEKIEVLVNTNSEYRNLIEELDAQNCAYRKKFEELGVQNIGYKKKLVELDLQNDKYGKKMDLLVRTNEYKKTKQELDIGNNELKTINAEIVVQNEENIKKVDLELQNVEYRKKITELEVQNNEYRNNIDELNAQNKQYKKEMGGLVVENNEYRKKAELELQNDQYMKNIQALEVQNNEYCKKLEQLHVTNGKFRRKIEKFDVTNKEYWKQMELEVQNNEFRKKLAQLEAINNEYRIEKEELEVHIIEYRRKNEELQLENYENMKKIENLNIQSNELEIQNEEYKLKKEDLDEYRRKNVELELENSEYRKKIALEVPNVEYTIKKQELELQSSEYMMGKEEMEPPNNEYRKKIEELLDQHIQYLRKIDELEAKINGYSEKIVGLKPPEAQNGENEIKNAEIGAKNKEIYTNIEETAIIREYKTELVSQNHENYSKNNEFPTNIKETTAIKPENTENKTELVPQKHEIDLKNNEFPTNFEETKEFKREDNKESCVIAQNNETERNPSCLLQQINSLKTYTEIWKQMRNENAELLRKNNSLATANEQLQREKQQLSDTTKASCLTEVEIEELMLTVREGVFNSEKKKVFNYTKGQAFNSKKEEVFNGKKEGAFNDKKEEVFNSKKEGSFNDKKEDDFNGNKEGSFNDKKEEVFNGKKEGSFNNKKEDDFNGKKEGAFNNNKEEVFNGTKEGIVGRITEEVRAIILEEREKMEAKSDNLKKEAEKLLKERSALEKEFRCINQKQMVGDLLEELKLLRKKFQNEKFEELQVKKLLSCIKSAINDDGLPEEANVNIFAEESQEILRDIKQIRCDLNEAKRYKKKYETISQKLACLLNAFAQYSQDKTVFKELSTDASGLKAFEQLSADKTAFECTDFDENPLQLKHQNATFAICTNSEDRNCDIGMNGEDLTCDIRMNGEDFNFDICRNSLDSIALNIQQTLTVLTETKTRNETLNSQLEALKTNNANITRVNQLLAKSLTNSEDDVSVMQCDGNIDFTQVEAFLTQKTRDNSLLDVFLLELNQVSYLLELNGCSKDVHSVKTTFARVRTTIEDNLLCKDCLKRLNAFFAVDEDSLFALEKKIIGEFKLKNVENEKLKEELKQRRNQEESIGGHEMAGKLHIGEENAGYSSRLRIGKEFTDGTENAASLWYHESAKEFIDGTENASALWHPENEETFIGEKEKGSSLLHSRIEGKFIGETEKAGSIRHLQTGEKFIGEMEKTGSIRHLQTGEKFKTGSIRHLQTGEKFIGEQEKEASLRHPEIARKFNDGQENAASFLHPENGWVFISEKENAASLLDPGIGEKFIGEKEQLACLLHLQTGGKFIDGQEKEASLWYHESARKFIDGTENAPSLLHLETGEINVDKENPGIGGKFIGEKEKAGYLMHLQTGEKFIDGRENAASSWHPETGGKFIGEKEKLASIMHLQTGEKFIDGREKATSLRHPEIARKFIDGTENAASSWHPGTEEKFIGDKDNPGIGGNFIGEKEKAGPETGGKFIGEKEKLASIMHLQTGETFIDGREKATSLRHPEIPWKFIGGTENAPSLLHLQTGEKFVLETEKPASSWYSEITRKFIDEQENTSSSWHAETAGKFIGEKEKVPSSFRPEIARKFIDEEENASSSWHPETGGEKAASLLNLLEVGSKFTDGNVKTASSQLHHKYLNLIEEYGQENTDLYAQNAAIKQHLTIIRDYKNKLKQSEELVQQFRSENARLNRLYLATAKSNEEVEKTSREKAEDLNKRLRKTLLRFEDVLSEKTALENQVDSLKSVNGTLKHSVLKLQEEIDVFSEEQSVLLREKQNARTLVKMLEVKTKESDEKEKELRTKCEKYERLQFEAAKDNDSQLLEVKTARERHEKLQLELKELEEAFEVERTGFTHAVRERDEQILRLREEKRALEQLNSGRINPKPRYIVNAQHETLLYEPRLQLIQHFKAINENPASKCDFLLKLNNYIDVNLELLQNAKCGSNRLLRLKDDLQLINDKHGGFVKPMRNKSLLKQLLEMGSVNEPTTKHDGALKVPSSDKLALEAKLKQTQNDEDVGSDKFEAIRDELVELKLQNERVIEEKTRNNEDTTDLQVLRSENANLRDELREKNAKLTHLLRENADFQAQLNASNANINKLEAQMNQAIRRYKELSRFELDSGRTRTSNELLQGLKESNTNGESPNVRLKPHEEAKIRCDLTQDALNESEFVKGNEKPVFNSKQAETTNSRIELVQDKPFRKTEKLDLQELYTKIKLLDNDKKEMEVRLNAALNENLTLKTRLDEEKRALNELQNSFEFDCKTRLRKINEKLAQYAQDKLEYQRDFDQLKRALLEEIAGLRGKMQQWDFGTVDFYAELKKLSLEAQVEKLRAFVGKCEAEAAVLLQQKMEASRLLNVLIGKMEKVECFKGASNGQNNEMQSNDEDKTGSNIGKYDERYNEMNAEIVLNEQFLREKLKVLENKKNVLQESFENVTDSDSFFEKIG